jgi:hypothetical protein|tara:strand:+ start:258 stop:464 length:207 start_codon:yes stop_codon:yes gene_type:complete
MAKPGTTKASRERIKKQRAKKRGRNAPSSGPAPMPNRLPDPHGRTTAYGGGRMTYSAGGEAMPKAKPC